MTRQIQNGQSLLLPSLSIINYRNAGLLLTLLEMWRGQMGRWAALAVGAVRVIQRFQ
jgi:hypothetical protein